MGGRGRVFRNLFPQHRYLNANGAVTVETHKGSIQVTTWDRAEVEIQARIQAEAGTSMDRYRFEGTEIHIDSPAEAGTTPRCATRSACRVRGGSQFAITVLRRRSPILVARSISIRIAARFGSSASAARCN